MPVVAAIDIGGSTTRVGVVALPEHLPEPGAVPSAPQPQLLATFPTEASYDAALVRLLTVLRAPALGDCAGVGVSIGGRVTRDGAAVDVAPNLPDYVGRPLARDLAAQCGLPVRLAHDTVCGLLGERQFGVLAGVERCAYLTVSTGTGAAVHLERAGTRLTLSIEVGHQLLAGNDLPCLCGQRGCLETRTGGRQVALRLGHGVEHVADAAFWEQLAECLAIGLVNLAHLTRVEVVAIGGGIALHRPTLLPSVQRQVEARLRGATLRLVPARLGAAAPLLGAAVLLHTPEAELLH